MNFPHSFHEYEKKKKYENASCKARCFYVLAYWWTAGVETGRRGLGRGWHEWEREKEEKLHNWMKTLLRGVYDLVSLTTLLMAILKEREKAPTTQHKQSKQTKKRSRIFLHTSKATREKNKQIKNTFPSIEERKKIHWKNFCFVCLFSFTQFSGR